MVIFHSYVSLPEGNHLLVKSGNPISAEKTTQSRKKVDEVNSYPHYSFCLMLMLDKNFNLYYYLHYSYPLVNFFITMERSTMFNGKLHYFYCHFQ